MIKFSEPTFVRLNNEKYFQQFRGGTPRKGKKEFWENGIVPWLTNSELEKNFVNRIFQTKNRITNLGLKYAPLVPRNSVLLTCTASIGKVGINYIELATNQQFNSFKCSDKILPKYLAYYFLRIRKDLQKIAGSTSFSHITLKSLYKIKIPIIPKNEQRLIVSNFEKLEKIHDKHHNIQVKLNNLTFSSFNKLFGDLMTNPKNWDKLSFSKIAKVEKNTISPSDIPEGTNYIGLEHIQKETGRILNFEITHSDSIKSTKFTFTSKHILYGKLRPYLNKVALPNFSGVCSTDILTIMPNYSLVTKEFLSSLMRQNFFVKFATEKSTGANLPRISPKEIEKFTIPVPPLHIQKSFTSYVQRFYALSDKQNKSQNYVNFLFESLLRMFFKNDGLTS